MDISYLNSVIDLYLGNENDHSKTCLSIMKTDDIVHFDFSMKKDAQDRTTIEIPVDMVNANLKYLLKKYKSDLIIIDEKYDYDKVSGTCYYYVLFKNGRMLSFHNFSLVEINNIRNYLYNIDIYQEEIRVKYEDEKEYVPKFSFQYAGFASFKTLFLITIFLLGVFILSLWAFELLIH